MWLEVCLTRLEERSKAFYGQVPKHLSMTFEGVAHTR